MTLKHFSHGLWIMTVLAVVKAIVAVRGELIRVPGSTSRAFPAVSGDSRDAQAHSSAADLQVIEESNLFQRYREPPSVIQNPMQAQTAVQQAPAPPKPRLVLRGIIGGPPWNAVLQGVPGRDGDVLVRSGDSVGGLKVRSISALGATIRGLDTAWNLKLSRGP